MQVRVCRDCGEEYRPEIAICADCGGELVSQWEDENGVRTGHAHLPEAPPEPEGFDLTGYRPVFLTNQAPALVPLAERLREVGITFRLHDDANPRSLNRFSLLVQEADAAQALRELAPLLDEIEAADRMDIVESEFDAANRCCPACSAAVSASASECPDCGLGLGGPSTTCARCGTPLSLDDVDCAACRSVEG